MGAYSSVSKHGSIQYSPDNCQSLNHMNRQPWIMKNGGANPIWLELPYNICCVPPCLSTPSPTLMFQWEADVCSLTEFTRIWGNNLCGKCMLQTFQFIVGVFLSEKWTAFPVANSSMHIPSEHVALKPTYYVSSM